MGCCYSRLEREEMVLRCKARESRMKHVVKARQAFSASHAMYHRALRNTGSSLLQFVTSERTHLPPQPSPLIQPPPPPPLSPMSETWTSLTASPALPPPPPPPPQTSTWDFWYPFMQPPPASPSVIDEEWDRATGTPVPEAAVTATDTSSTRAPHSLSPVRFSSKEGGSGSGSGSGSSSIVLAVPKAGKDAAAVVKEVEGYFDKAADACSQLSVLLDGSSPNFCGQVKSGKTYNYGFNFSNPVRRGWNFSQKSCEGITGNGSGKCVGMGHCSTIERLYAWEKKLHQEVKHAERIRIDHENKAGIVRKLEIRRGDYIKTHNAMKELEKLESQMMVAIHMAETTSTEIIRLRETELYPQLLELVKGLMCMWRCIYESHHLQFHVIQQLKHLHTPPSVEPTSVMHRQSTLELELQVQQWHHSFCNLIKAHRDYVHSLMAWLSVSLFRFTRNPPATAHHDSKIYKLCEEWLHATDRIPDKVAAEGIQNFLGSVRAIVVQQADENKQKKKTESVYRELEKKVAELRFLNGDTDRDPYLSRGWSRRFDDGESVLEKRGKMEALRSRAEEEKSRHEKMAGISRAMTMNSLQVGLPQVFQTMVGFSSVCVHVFEGVYNAAKTDKVEENEVKMISS